MEEQLTALLASVAGGRRYWVRAPQSVKAKDGAYIVLNRIDGARDYTMDGASGYVASRVQADVYAATYALTKAAVRALETAVSGYSGGIIQGIFIESERDLPASDAGEANHLFRTSLDLIIHTQEN